MGNDKGQMAGQAADQRDARSPCHPVTLSSCHAVICLVGGIGAGKSAVAAEFARRGARVIAGDTLGHEALRETSVRQAIVRRWGPGVLDEHGEVQRKKLAAIVFADAQERKALEEITHPWIRRRIEQEVQSARQHAGPGLVVVDAAVLLEAGWHGVCDRLVYVDAPRDVRLARVRAMRGWAENDLEEREAAQLPLTWKQGRADHVLDNSSTLENLSRQVDDLIRHWGLAPASAPRTGSMSDRVPS